MALTLNERAWRVADHLERQAEMTRIGIHNVAGARILDCGIQTRGSLQAGLGLAKVCLSDLAEVSLAPSSREGLPCPMVQVRTDHPVAACMASQYAGWQIALDDYFAMGSGPMRAAYGHEELFADISGKESPPVAVGVVETSKLPTEEMVAYLTERIGLPASKLTLLATPASSLAGSIQVVARSVETALHKLHELKFDLSQVVSALGSAPLPPVATKELEAIGRTNDAILYASEVMLWVDADDDELRTVGPKVPSSASSDHGAPFAEVLKRCDGDFYKIDPSLFSPAVIVFLNLRSGNSFSFGHFEFEIVDKSFFGSG